MGTKKKIDSQTMQTRLSKQPRDDFGGAQHTDQPPTDSLNWTERQEARIWQVLALIPVGKVVSYGQLAELAGRPRQARWAGRVLRRLPADSRLPWHRVVNARLQIALRGTAALHQQARLQAEGVECVNFRVAAAHRWKP